MYAISTTNVQLVDYEQSFVSSLVRAKKLASENDGAIFSLARGKKLEVGAEKKPEKIRLVRDSNPMTSAIPDKLPVGLLAQLVRALHRYRRGHHRVRIPYKPDFFRLSFHNCKSCVYNCDDLLSI